jgi:hypothetical protein
MLIDWVIDYFDVSCGQWEMGNATKLNDGSICIEIESLGFSGEVALDFECVRLVECVDDVSMELFKQIIKDSALSVDWSVRFLDEDTGDFRTGIALKYLPATNQVRIMVSQQDGGGSKARYVYVTVDEDIQLTKCNDNSSKALFGRLNREIDREIQRMMNGSPSLNEASPTAASGQYRGGSSSGGGSKWWDWTLPSAVGEEGVSVDWVIDFYDESQEDWIMGNGLVFHGTHLYIEVSDAELNAEFRGKVPLDSRRLRLVECVDERSWALYKEVVTKSTVQVRW